MQRLLLALACLLISSFPMLARADVVYSMREYFDSLATPYPAQSLANPWTFHSGSSSGALLPTTGGQVYRHADNVQQIGSPVNIGESQCSPGFCPASPATTRATFDGVFVHSGGTSATVAAFRVGAAATLSSIELLSEMVANGNNGNGFNVTVRALTGGGMNASILGSFVFNYANTVNAANTQLYTPGLALQAGDIIEILYGNNGSFLYDHGNVEARITLAGTGPGPQPVPAPLALGLLGVGLALSGRLAARR